MTEEDEEFTRIEREARMRKLARSDDDTQVYAKAWVGLTDDEFEDIELRCSSTPFGKIEAMRKVEAKLREKNA